MKIYKLRDIESRKYWMGGNLLYRDSAFRYKFHKDGKIWTKERYLKSALLNVTNVNNKTPIENEYANYLMNNCEVVVYEVTESEILNPKDITK